METNSSYKDKLRAQIKESYGKVTYSYTSHIKMVQILEKKSNFLRFNQIILSGITGSSLFYLIFTDETIVNIVGAIASVILLIISSISKSFGYEERIRQHIQAHDSYWKVRDNYISLITDFETLELKDITYKRDLLSNETDEINRRYPKTSKKAYIAAQKSLQYENEQTFIPGEVDKLLPQQK